MIRRLFLAVLAARLVCAASVENAVCLKTGPSSYRITFDGASAKNEVTIFASPRADKIVSKKAVAKATSSPVEVMVPSSGRVYFHLKPNSGTTRVVSVRQLPLEMSFNFRDLGGYKTTSGKYVRWGMVYRSGRLDGLTKKDFEYLSSIGLKLICDFRMEKEWSVAETKWQGTPAPEVLHDSIDYTWSPNRPANAAGGREPGGDGGPSPTANASQAPLPGTAMGQTPGPGQNAGRGLAGNVAPALPGNASNSQPSGRGPANANAQGGVPRAPRTIGWIDGSTEALAVPFRRIAAGHVPMLFHCNMGRDRTGMFAALLLGVLGVPLETIIQDADLTNVYGQQATSLAEYIPELQRPGSPAPDLETLKTHVSTDTAPLKATLEMLNRKYGSIEGYLLQVVKLTPKEIGAVRQRLLEP